MTPAPLIIRCSSLDRVIECSGSLEESDAPYNPNNPDANRGQANHAALKALVLGEIPAIDDIAAEYSVDADELTKVVSRAQAAWREVVQWFGGERSADSETMSAALNDDVELRGTPDLMALTRAAILEALSILDWKTGHAPTEHPHQLAGYAYLARAKHGMPASGYILGIEVWVMLGELRIHRFYDADLDRLRDDVLEQVRRRGRQYGPSVEACKYCPLQNGCQARAEWMRSGVTALEPMMANAPVTRELIGALYERRKELGRALARYDEVLKGMVPDGPVPLPDGRQLVLVAEEEDHLRPSKAMPHLREDLQLTPEEADQVLRVTKGGLERVLKGRVVRGKGAAAMRASMQRLTELGAVERVTSHAIKPVASPSGGEKR